MTDLFTHAESRAAAEHRRDLGMALAGRAQDAKDPEFRERAFQAIVRLAQVQREVHIDDFLQVFPAAMTCEHPDCLGPVWQRAIRAKVLGRSKEVRACIVDPKKHAHEYKVYPSLIYRGAP